MVSAVLIVAATMLWSPALQAQAPATGPDVDRYFSAGEWEEAFNEALVRDDAASLRMRALFAHWAGDDEDALRFARTAVEVRSRAGQQRRSQAMLARLQWFVGQRDEAIDGLRAQLQQAPDDVELRYELGSMLIDDGEIHEGRAILEALGRRHNDGLITEVDDLVWLGRAMMAAHRPRDANRALSRALREDEDHMEANLRMGQLMQARYNTAEAEASFEKVLEQHPDHPEALVGMARIEFFRSGRFRESMELVQRAYALYPGHPAVVRARAQLLIAQGQWEEGKAVAQQLLNRAPQDGEALAIRGSASFLLGDQGDFEDAKAAFDERRQNRPEFLTTVAESAAMNKRHGDAVLLFEEALARDDEHSAALTGLGMALTRIGEEIRGIDILERAFDADRYHVRTFNTLEFFEKGLRDYITDDVEGFRLRAHLSQFDLLREMSVPLIREATREFTARYGIELPSLIVEVYPDPQAFSVRSVGLPNIDPHGICFGPVILTRSPGDANFNWALVMWHELAHSYHLELSDYRVPVWFTEGLAEYETWKRDPSWTRFHDVDLARRLAHGQMWTISEMDEVFMTGRGFDVSHAYQVAHLVMIFLEEAYGFDVIVEMLKAFAEESRTERVFEAILEKNIEAIDSEFDDWLRKRYASLLNQELIDYMRLQAMQREEDVEHRTRAEASAYRAMAAAARGDREEAVLHLNNAQRRGADEPVVAVLSVSTYDLLDDVQAGLDAGRQALDRGIESFDLRFNLSRLAGRAERHEEAFVHALAATTLYPGEPEGWRQLESRATAVGEEGLVRQAQREIFERNAHAPHLARRRVASLEEHGDYDGAHRAARRWADIASLDAEAHLAVGRNALRLGDLEAARTSWRIATMASPARRAEILRIAAEELRRANLSESAEEFERRAQQEESSR